MRSKKKIILGTISLIITFAILIIVILLSVDTPDINLKDENFDGIDLMQNIINKLNVGEILKDTLNPNFHYSSNGMKIITDDNKNITNLAITHDTDKNVKTSKGISVGDSLEEVTKYYGEDYYKRREQGVEKWVI